MTQIPTTILDLRIGLACAQTFLSRLLPFPLISRDFSRQITAIVFIAN